MFTITLYRDCLIRRLDVNNAFLKEVLHEKAFMEQFVGFI